MWVKFRGIPMKRWQIKTSALNLEMDNQKLWRLVKQLNNEAHQRGQRQPTELE